MIKSFSLFALLLFAFVIMGAAQAQNTKVPEVKQEGNLHVLKMSGLYRFHEVIDMLKVHLFEEGWIVRDIQDVDVAISKLGKLVPNKIIRVSKPAYLIDTVEESQMNALTHTQSIIVYQVFEDDDESEIQTIGPVPGEIVIAFIDPVKMAKFVNLPKPQHLDDTRKELKKALEETARFFVESQISTMPVPSN
ncbi:MAG: hypothetical protein RQ936_07615 [Gammaproteobacteria bacterium]|nr:hypothetical protein [Gammaproteobacteria bacterium]